MPDSHPARSGDAIWMLNAWMRFVATSADTAGRLAIIEKRSTPGGDPPPHVHTNEDELFYVLQGRVTATIEGDPPISAGAGEGVFLPRGRAHSLNAETPELHGLVILTPAGFEQFFAAVGRPAKTDALPAPSAPDVPALIRTAADYGVTIFPPG